MYVAIAVTTIPTLVACFLPATHLTHLEPSTPPRYHLKKRKKWQARRRRRWRCKQKKMRSGDGPRTCSKLQFPYLHVGHPPAAHHLSLPPLLQFFVLLLLVLFLLLRISFLPSFLPSFLVLVLCCLLPFIHNIRLLHKSISEQQQSKHRKIWRPVQRPSLRQKKINYQ